MTRRISSVLILSLLILAFSASTVFSGDNPFAPKKRKAYNPAAKRVNAYVLESDMNQANSFGPKGGESNGASLGASSPSVSPGNILGYSYYDWQTNSYIGRMVQVGRNYDNTVAGDSLALVHFVWMNSPTATLTSGHRGPSYSFYDASTAGYAGEVEMTFDPQRSGYFKSEITRKSPTHGGNQFIVCGHYDPTGDVTSFEPQVWYDDAPGNQGFSFVAEVPDAHWQWQNPYTGDASNLIWPDVAFQQRASGNHVTHVTGVTVGGANIMYYFRKEATAASALNLGGVSPCGSPADAQWSCPYIPDTLQWAQPQGVSASELSGNVALYWWTQLPPVGGCDTCSNNTAHPDGFDYTDFYVQISSDYGVTWGPTNNVTKTDSLTSEWGPYFDFAGLWDNGDEFHLAWVAQNTARYRAEGNSGFGCRIYHWKQSFDTNAPNSGDARIAMSLNPGDPDTCNGNPNSLYLARIGMAECNGNLYITATDMWEGHNGDPANPDCSYRAYNGSNPYGSVNGELVVAISDDDGSTFDLFHNITNSPTPHCDSADGSVGACESDNWSTITERGFPTRAADDWSGTVTVNPRPSVSYPDGPGVQWLHMQYVNDLDAGTGLFPADGSRILDNPLRHFRLACVPPAEVPVPIYNIAEITWPFFVKPDSQKNVSVLAENIGNASTPFAAIPEEDTGPAGWLTVNGVAGVLNEGTNNKDTFNIHLSAVGISQEKINEAGGTTIVFGRVLFDHNGPSDVDTIPVTLIVTDTILLPTYDTISTGVVSLQVATNGQYGGEEEGMGLDYWFDPAECDTVDSIPGSTATYIFDGSYLVGGVEPSGDTILTNQVFGVGPRTPASNYQTTAQTAPAVSGINQVWSSGKSVNHDTTLAFTMRWFAPQVTASYGTWQADQQFVARELKVWATDGVAHNDLTIGDLVDWDVPGDSVGLGIANTGDTSGVRRLVYQRGAEYNQDNAVECQDNDTRFGGMAFGYLRAYWNHDANGATPRVWTVRDSVGYGGYVNANARIGFPLSSEDQYALMEANSGYHPWSHINPDSQKIDLHSCLIAAFGYDLVGGATPANTDTVAVYTVYASVLEDLAGPARIQQLAERGRTFARYWGCCVGTKGDLNGDGNEANVIDLNFAVNKIFRGGINTSCFGEGDVNSDKVILNVVDLNFLVNKIFRGGAAPAICNFAMTPS